MIRPHLGTQKNQKLLLMISIEYYRYYHEYVYISPLAEHYCANINGRQKKKKEVDLMILPSIHAISNRY